ncbi:KIR protein [Plasmodium coatneyi]|uniref:KIR protein n=1 Tax=Plasmodium coatneyi TaxID=208452 RepID=A0A1B1E1V4_9APIC|nr:KIR protein [Plasmodium coatneyi]ANQ09014.1 KIR protein [Plasmodium coatneyi]
MNQDLQCKVEDLPSRKVYKAFGKNGEHGKHTCTDITNWEEQMEEIVTTALSSPLFDGLDYVKEIAQASCLLSKLKTDSSSCSRICDFFYFWLGDKLCEKVKNIIKVRSIMQGIYQKLGSNNGQCNYQEMNDNFGCPNFRRAKTIFAYYHDYKTIWTALKDSKSRGSSSCCTAYNDYLQQAQYAYGQIQAGWSLNQDDYFAEFWDKFEGNGNGSGTIPKPGELKNKALSEGGDPPPLEGDEDGTDVPSCLTQLLSQPSELAAAPSLPQQDGAASAAAGSSSNIVAPIVSSAVAGIGLPAAVAFFLYKVITIILAKMNNNNDILFIFT